MAAEKRSVEGGAGGLGVDALKGWGGPQGESLGSGRGAERADKEEVKEKQRPGGRSERRRERRRRIGRNEHAGRRERKVEGLHFSRCSSLVIFYSTSLSSDRSHFSPRCRPTFFFLKESPSLHCRLFLLPAELKKRCVIRRAPSVNETTRRLLV